MNTSLHGLGLTIVMPIFNESDGIAETLTCHWLRLRTSQHLGRYGQAILK